MGADPSDSVSSAVRSSSPVRQLSVFLGNRIGSLLSIVDLLNRHHFVVLGISVKDSIDVSVVRLIVSDPDSVETLFMEKGIPFNTTEVLVVDLPKGASQMAEVLRELLNAETNIHFIYPIMTRPNGNSAIAMCVEDNDFGLEVLNQAGYRILSQDDLSR